MYNYNITPVCQTSKLIQFVIISFFSKIQLIKYSIIYMYIKIMKCIQLNSVHWHHHVGIQSNEIKYDTYTIIFSIFMVEHNFFKSGGLSQPC